MDRQSSTRRLRLVLSRKYTRTMKNKGERAQSQQGRRAWVPGANRGRGLASSVRVHLLVTAGRVHISAGAGSAGAGSTVFSCLHVMSNWPCHLYAKFQTA